MCVWGEGGKVGGGGGGRSVLLLSNAVIPSNWCQQSGFCATGGRRCHARPKDACARNFRLEASPARYDVASENLTA